MSQIKCCGKKLTTAFCPHCGSPAPKTPLRQLLLHCQQLQQTSEEMLQLRRQQLSKLPKKTPAWTREALIKLCGSSESSVAKWASYAAALKDVLDQETTHGS